MPADSAKNFGWMFKGLCLITGFPAPRGATGKYKPGGGDRKSDFLGADAAAEFGFYGNPQHVGKDRRGQPGGVGVDEEEERVVR